MSENRLSSQYGAGQVTHYYNLWRNAANNTGRTGPYDEPDWQGGRLYFRSDYTAKVEKSPEWAQSGYWGAWIIEPKQREYFCVLRSLLHERAAERSEEIQAIFSHFEDAGKYVILQIGDSLRYRLGLDTLHVKWEDSGPNARIQVESAGRDIVDFILSQKPDLKRESVERYLRKYTLMDGDQTYAFTSSGYQVDMEVLALSFDELTAELLEGMPDSVASQIQR